MKKSNKNESFCRGRNGRMGERLRTCVESGDLIGLKRELLENGDAERVLSEVPVILFALQLGQRDVALWLARQYGDINLPVKNRYGENALMYVCRNGDVESARVFLENGAAPTIESQNMHGSTSLMGACGNGHVDVVKLLVEEFGSNVNVRNSNQMTALIFACESRPILNAVLVVRILLEHGAETETEDSIRHSTPLARVCSRGSMDLANLLLDYGAKVNWQDKRGRTALMSACENGNADVAELLVKRDAEIDVQDASGQTALSYACENREFDAIHVVRFLVLAGANLEVLGNDGLDAVEVARKTGSLAGDDEVCRLLDFAMRSEVARLIELEAKLSRKVLLAFFDNQLLTLDDCRSLSHSEWKDMGLSESTCIFFS